jgi:hypothetical protein
MEVLTWDRLIVVQASGLLPGQARSLHHNGSFEDLDNLRSYEERFLSILMLRLPNFFIMESEAAGAGADFKLYFSRWGAIAPELSFDGSGHNGQ